METEIRITGPTLKVLKMLIEKPLESRSGADFSRTLRISSGTLYPLLARLENAGWIVGEWENLDPSEAGRPRRRLYRLTASGQNAAAKSLGEFQTAPGVLIWNS